MSTLVMVEKAGIACMAADTLTSFGLRKESARYVARPETIIEVDGSYIGLVGWCAHHGVLLSALANGLELPRFASEQELFEFSRKLHRKLKKEYFLNTGDDYHDSYESSQMMLFILNWNGMFRLCSDRAVDRCQRFVAAGTGTPFALGAMHSAYEQDLPAEEIARAGVEAGIEFDCASLGPITLRRVEIDAKRARWRELEAMRS